MDISKLSESGLKALAYDLIANIEVVQRDLSIVNIEIGKRAAITNSYISTSAIVQSLNKHNSKPEK